MLHRKLKVDEVIGSIVVGIVVEGKIHRHYIDELQNHNFFFLRYYDLVACQSCI